MQRRSGAPDAVSGCHLMTFSFVKVGLSDVCDHKDLLRDSSTVKSLSGKKDVCNIQWRWGLHGPGSGEVTLCAAGRIVLLGGTTATEDNVWGWTSTWMSGSSVLMCWSGVKVPAENAVVPVSIYWGSVHHFKGSQHRLRCAAGDSLSVFLKDTSARRLFASTGLDLWPSSWRTVSLMRPHCLLCFPDQKAFIRAWSSAKTGRIYNGLTD